MKHLLIAGRRLLAGGGYPSAGGDNLRQGNQAFKRLGAFRPVAILPVGKLVHPMLYAYGQLFPADRASALILIGLGRFQANAAVCLLYTSTSAEGEHLGKEGAQLSQIGDGEQAPRDEEQKEHIHICLLYTSRSFFISAYMAFFAWAKKRSL